MIVRTKKANNDLLQSIIKGMEDVKANDIVVMDMTNLIGAVCDQFIICHANNTTQVSGIADKIQEYTKKDLGEDPWKTEGLRTSQWVILDYVNIVAHIFHKDARSFYDLEELWGDAEIIRISEETTEPVKVRKANRN
jgi:ribosome-associated protein